LDEEMKRGEVREGGGKTSDGRVKMGMEMVEEK